VATISDSATRCSIFYRGNVKCFSFLCAPQRLWSCTFWIILYCCFFPLQIYRLCVKLVVHFGWLHA
jgi:hypothetical protein